jgi:hypothetical protein
MASSKQQLDPRYLRGVIDALELVSSFVAWKEAHPESKRTAREFIQETLQKLERKSEQKLDRTLGIHFED